MSWTTKFALDYSANGDDIDTFAQKYMSEISNIYALLNRLRTLDSSAGTTLDDVEAFQLKINQTTNDILIRNATNDAWIILGKLAANFGITPQAINAIKGAGSITVGLLASRPIAVNSTDGDMYIALEGDMYYFTSGAWKLILTMNIENLNDYSKLITTDMVSVTSAANKILKTDLEGKLDASVKGTAQGLSGYPLDMTNIGDGKVIAYSQANGKLYFETAGASAGGGSAVGVITGRENSKVYAVGAMVYSSRLPSGTFLTAVQAGTSDEFQPDYDNPVNGLIVDGSVLWRKDTLKGVNLQVDSDYPLNQVEGDLIINTQSINPDGGKNAVLKIKVGESYFPIYLAADNTALIESTGYGIISGLQVNPQAVPDMTIRVVAGVVHMPNGRRYSVAVIPSIAVSAADSTGSRHDLVYLDVNGAVKYVAGSLATPAVKGARTYTATTNFVTGDKITIGSVTLTAGTDFTAGTTISDTVTSIISALNANTTITNTYDVSGGASLFTLVEKTAGGGNTPANSSTTGTGVISNGVAVTSAVSTFTAPTLPENTVELATIAVSANQTTITAGNITDKRVFKLNVLNALNLRKANTSYAVGDISYSLNLPAGEYLECTVAGITVAAEPTYPAAGNTVVDGSATWLVRDIRKVDQATKLKTPVKINGVSFDGSADILTTAGVCNHIAIGRKIASIAGLTATITTGKTIINNKVVTYNQNSIDLPAIKAALIYDDENGNTGYIAAKYPTDYIDNNTVGFWIFNKSGNIPNSAVGVSSIAVANDLVPTGGVSIVDGHADYALKLDGTSGYLVGANTTNFPSGAAERELTFMFTYNKAPSADAIIINYGAGAASQAFGLYVTTGGKLSVWYYTTVYDPNFYLEVGKTYIGAVQYDGAYTYIYINGVLIYKSASFTASTTLTYSLYVGHSTWATTGYSYITAHYVELRNKMRSDAKTAEIANKLMLPCFYTKTAAVYPTIPSAYAASYHEYRMDETSGTTVADSNTSAALNGTATGTTIIESPIGLGKARSFTGSGSNINLGTFACGSKFSFIGIVKSGAGTQTLWSNRPSTSSGNLIYIDTGVLYLYIAGTSYTLATNISSKDALIVGVFIDGTTATVYIGNQKYVVTVGALSTAANTAYLGYDVPGTYLTGSLDYALFGNFVLSDLDYKQIYTALMTTGRRSIIDDVVPTNAVSVAYVKTGSNGVTDYNDLWPMYGRREGATGGNRKMFLGWIPFVAGSIPIWANPFGTRKLDLSFAWASDASGTNECKIIDTDISGDYGIYSKYTSNNAITCQTSGNGVVHINGAWKTTGFIGCYAEMLEDYTGVV